jgi:hypothetical protein
MHKKLLGKKRKKTSKENFICEKKKFLAEKSLKSLEFMLLEVRWSSKSFNIYVYMCTSGSGKFKEPF